MAELTAFIHATDQDPELAASVAGLLGVDWAALDFEQRYQAYRHYLRGAREVERQLARQKELKELARLKGEG